MKQQAQSSKLHNLQIDQFLLQLHMGCIEYMKTLKLLFVVANVTFFTLVVGGPRCQFTK